MLTTTRVRLAGALGAFYILAILVGNGLSTAGTTQSAHPTGQQILHDVAAQAGDTGPALGFALEVLGFLAFLLLLGLMLGIRGARSDEESAAAPAVAVTVVAGLLMLAIKLGSAAPALALQMDYKRLTPELAQVLNDMNGAAFVVSWLPFAVVIAALAVAWSRLGLIGRPSLMTGLVVGIVGVPVAVIGMLDPVGATPIAFLLALLWLLVVSLRLVIRPGVGATA
jgi:hypothetical protein